MKSLSRLYLALFAFAGLMLSASTSQAAVTVNVPFAGIHVLATVNSQIVLLSKPNLFSTSCTLTVVVNANGTKDQIGIIGSSATDWIETTGSTYSYCGYTLSAVDLQGSGSIVLLGGNGDDGLSNQWNPRVTVNGQNGNDQLWNGTSTQNYPMYGGPGNDRFEVNALDYAQGESGDDTFVVTGATPYKVEGGTHVNGDRLCGSSPYTGIELFGGC